MTQPDTDITYGTWQRADLALPKGRQIVAVKGDDTAGEWEITDGIWWQPYKGQSHFQGRWMQKMRTESPCDCRNRMK